MRRYLKNQGVLNSFLFRLHPRPSAWIRGPSVWICWPCLRKARCQRFAWDSTVGGWRELDSL
jgi:hypothetical protein